MATLVYRYGVPARIETGVRGDLGGIRTAPVVPPPKLMQQVRLAHDLRNDAVAAWRRWQQAKLDLWSQYPAIAEIERKLDEAEVEAEQASRDVAAANSGARSRTRTRTDDDRRLTAAKKRVRELKAARKMAIGSAYEQDSSVPQRLQELRDRYEAELKGLYWTYTDQRNPERKGLHWASTNAALLDHKTAAKKIRDDRTGGQPADMRFKRWDGTGTIAVQLQRMHGPDCRCVPCAAKLTIKARKADPDAAEVLPDPSTQPVDPPRTPPLLASGGGKWRNVLRLTPWQEDQPAQPIRGTVAFHLGDGEMAELPVVLHRMMPAAADVCEAQITVTEAPGQPEGQGLRIALAVTVYEPDPPAPTGSNTVAMHIGWRAQGDGSVRVATWATTQPITVPDRLTKVTTRVMSKRRQAATGGDPYVHEAVVVATSPTTGEIFIPASWIDTAGRPAAIRGQRDKDFDAVKETVAAWLDRHPQQATETPPELTGEAVRRWRNPARLAGLAHRWTETPPVGDDIAPIITTLTEWQHQDHHLWAYEANERDQLIRRRADFFRQVAAWLTNNAGAVIVDDTDLTQLRRRPSRTDDPAGRALHPLAEDKARARAALIAPGELRAALTKAAARRRLPADAKPAPTRTCPTCHHTGPAGDPRYAAAAVVTCPHCGRTYDQDHSVVAIWLRAARSSHTNA